MFIGISGLIGAGKSTLTRNLVEHLSRDGTPWRACFEPVKENPYLTDFYKDIARWTFPMQMFLLAKRFQLHQEVVWDPRHQKGGGVVQDRTIYEDVVFATMHQEDGLMDARDYDTYTSHFNIMRRYLVYPDVIVYLRVPPVVALARIQERGRESERGIPLEYLQRLHEGYESFVEEMSRYTVVIPVDWTEYKPTEEVLASIQDSVSQNQKFIRSLKRI